MHARDPRHRRLSPYLYVADVVRGRRVVEIGCGAGDGAEYLSRLGAAEVLGLDAKPREIQAAIGRGAQGLEFRVADYDALGLGPGSAEVICVPDATDLLRWPEFLDEVKRALA